MDYLYLFMRISMTEYSDISFFVIIMYLSWKNSMIKNK